MEYRQVGTNFWKDSYTHKLSHIEKLAFLYLFTNDRVTMCGIYELPDDFAILELGITKEQYEEIKKKFYADSKYMFYKDYVYILNFHKHNTFSTADNILRKYQRQFNAIPLHIKEWFFNKEPYVPLVTSTTKVNINYTNNIMDIISVMDIVMESRVRPRVAPRVQEDVNIDDIPL